MLSDLLGYTIRVNPKIQLLERQIAGIKRELADLGDLRVGTLSQQYGVCGTPGCRCKASPPAKHGPYYQLSYTRKGKGTTRFVRREVLSTVKAQLRNYAQFRRLVDRWVDLGTELSALKIEESRAARVRRRA